MHENRTGTAISPQCSSSSFPLLSASALQLWLGLGGATWPLTNSELGSVTGWASSSSSWGPWIIGSWFLLYSLDALLSTARKWPRDGVLFTTSASVVSLEHKEKIHVLDLQLFLSSTTSTFLALVDFLESSSMLETPIRLPSVMLLSWKKDPVDWNQSWIDEQY